MGLLVSKGHVLQSTCALIPSCSDLTRMDQVSVLKCHPWIGMLTHTVLEGFITEVNHMYRVT